MITRYDKLRIITVDASDVPRFEEQYGKRAHCIKVHPHGNAYLVTEKVFNELQVQSAFRVANVSELIKRGANDKEDIGAIVDAGYQPTGIISADSSCPSSGG